MRPPLLPVETLLADTADRPRHGTEIGRSREGRPIEAWRLGRGRHHLSLIAGCHADEPVGPLTLRRLLAFLQALPAADPLNDEYSWFVVPDVNPDGAQRNAPWVERTVPTLTADGVPGEGYDLRAYALGVERELPGDDVEFGFPRTARDAGGRPENRAVADFLAPGAPFALHGTLHGMGIAPGPWFLLEPAWIERTAALRETLRRRVKAMGLALLDVDRGGEKGFSRIDEGFSTRPDSVAMRDHFLARDEPATAALFRPSSMEFVRQLGGDPLTFVSEMPLFLVDSFRAGTEARLELHAWLAAAARQPDHEAFARQAKERGIRPMAIADQIGLQLELINAGLLAVAAAE